MVKPLNGIERNISKNPMIDATNVTGCRMHSSSVFRVSASSFSIQAIEGLSKESKKLFVKTSARLNTVYDVGVNYFPTKPVCDTISKPQSPP